MKHLLFLFLLLLPIAAWAQYPNAPNKIVLGRQTTGDGLVVRTAAAPSWTPSSINNAWLAFDTVAGAFFYYDAATWNELRSDAIDSLVVSNDTILLYTPDETFFAVLPPGSVGTVTSITAGVGLTGGTITSSGTIAADTAGMLVSKSFLTNQGYTTNAGTVTSVGTGYGLTGGPITGTGTIVADTSELASKTYVTTRGYLTSEVDGSVSNEGSLTVGAGTATTSVINSNTSGSTGVTLEAAGTGIAISESGNTITLTGSGTTGTGTTNTIAKWTSSTALGNSLFTDDGTNSVAGGTASFRLPNGTTAQRPGSPAAGMTRYNTDLGNLDFYGASAWENPVKSTTGNGLGTSTHIGFFDTNGRLNGTANLTWDGFKLNFKHGLTSTNLFIQGGNNTVTGGYNIAMGPSALAAVTSGALNAAFGPAALMTLTTGSNNFAIGSSAARGITTGLNNVAIGVDALRAPGGSSAATDNVGLGFSAGYSITSGGANTFVGGTAGYANTTGEGNAYISYRAARFATTGNFNVAIGGQSLGFGTGTTFAGADRNIVIGFQAGYSLADNDDANVMIGYQAGYSETGSNTLYIENSNSTTPLIGGNFTANTVGINTAVASIARTLHVTGEARITDLATDTPTRIVGADADGDLGAITVGSGLSLSGGTLTATGDGSGMADPGSNGIVVRTASNVTTARTITAGSGIAVSNGDGVSGNPTISQTYSLSHITISGGSTTFTTTFERPDNDTPGTATTQTVGTEFSPTGSTVDYTGGNGAVIRVEGTVSFSISDNMDVYISLFKEGTEIAATSTRVTCVAGDYYTIPLPVTTVTGNTNDTFDIRIATVTGTATTTMHRAGFMLTKIY